MQKQHKLGKFGTVFATRVAVSERDRAQEKVTHSLYLDTEVPGAEWGKSPGLRINGIHYRLSGHVIREQFEKHARVYFRHLRLQRKGSDADATQAAYNAVHSLALELAGRLIDDPLWIAETDVELAEQRLEKARENTANAETALQEANEAQASAVYQMGVAKKALREMRGNIE